MLSKNSLRYAPWLIAAGILSIASFYDVRAQVKDDRWKEVATLDFTVNVMLTEGATLYAGTNGGGVYRSTNNSQSWEAVNSGLFANAAVFAIKAIGANIFIGTDKGVYRSANQGRNWTETNVGLTYNTGSGSAPRSIATLEANGMTLFAGASRVDGVSGISVSVFRSDDLGANWSEVKTGLPSIISCSSIAAGPAGLFAATSAGLYRSGDGGQNWAFSNFSNPTFVAIIGQSVFASRDEEVWRSNDLGLNWTEVLNAPTGPLGGSITQLTSSGLNLFAKSSAIANPTTSYFSVRFSPDLGATWFDTEVPDLNTPPATITAFHSSGDQLFACKSDRKILVRRGFYSPGIAAFSAASYLDLYLAAESLAAVFGNNMASTSQSSSSVPLPVNIGGTAVKVRDSAGVERDAPLLFVSPSQINFQIPAGTADGIAIITVKLNDVTVGQGQMLMQPVAPGLFTANSNGYGAPAAIIQRVKANGDVQYESVAEFNPPGRDFVPREIDFGPETDQLYLILFGTGLKNRSSLNAVRMSSNGGFFPVMYAGPQGEYVGVEQINVALPRSLKGIGQLFFTIDVDGVPSNVVLMLIK